MGSTKYPLIPPPGGGAPNLPVPGQPAPMAPGEFAPGSIANVTKFQFEGTDPPSTLYLQRDDILVILAVSSIANETVTVNGRFLRVPEVQGGQPSDGGVGKHPGAIFTRGIIEPMQEVINLPTARSGVTVVRNMAEGYLLSIAARAAVSQTRGQTFFRVAVFRPPVTANLQGLVMVADYITQGQIAGWPYGRALNVIEGPGQKHSVQVANPAAGADWTLTVLPNQRLRVESFTAQLVTSATVANRNVEVIVDDGANVVWRTSIPASITAGTTSFVSGTGSNQPTGVVTTDITILIPPGLILEPGWRVRTNTAGIQVGDQWSNIWFAVEEWLENT